MNILVFILSLINIAAPIAIVGVIAWRHRLLKRTAGYIVVPSMMMMSIFYAILEYVGIFEPAFNVSLMKYPLRAVIASMLLSILIYFVLDLLITLRLVNGE